MTNRQLQRIKKDLEARLTSPALRKAELVDTEIGGDAVDEANGRSMRDFIAVTLNDQEQQRRRIVAALKRIDAGEYGICEECGEPISPRRLEAAPWASTCIGCQQALEEEEELALASRAVRI